MKKIILFLFACIAISMQTHAQFQYSVKAGCSWNNINDAEWALLKEKPSFTIGANVDYTIKYFGVQTGVNFQQIRNRERSIELCGPVSIFNNTASYLNVPLLATIRTAQHPKLCNLIIGAGPFINIHLGDSNGYNYGKNSNYLHKSYFGIMATAQLEFYAHYFIRAEQQWALKSDRKIWDETRTNTFSLVAGYKF